MLSNFSFHKKLFVLLTAAFLIAVVFLPYSSVLKNGPVHLGDEAHLTTFTSTIENKILGNDLFLQHAGSLALHSAIVLLIFFFLLRCLKLPIGAATIAALLFGLHPIHVEPVAWATGRKDILYSLFYLAGLYSYWRYLETRKRSLYAWTIVFCVLGMFSSPMAFSFPFILLLCDWLFGRKMTRDVLFEKIPYFLFAIFVFGITRSFKFFVLSEAGNLTEIVLVWVWALVSHLRHFFFSYLFVPVYPAPQPISLFNLSYAFSIAAFLLFALVIFIFRKNKWVVFSFGFYALSVLFSLKIKYAPDDIIISNRFMYLASLGFCILIGVYFEQVMGRARNKGGIIKRAAWFLLISFFLVLSAKTFFQTRIWKNSETLWSYQLRHFPNTPAALVNLASLKSSRSKFDVGEVIALYEKAIVVSPTYTQAYYCLGNLYKDIHEYTRAVTVYRKVLALDSSYKDTNFNLGWIYLEIGQVSDAILAFERVIAQDPLNEQSYMDVLGAYFKVIKKGQNDARYKEAQAKVANAYIYLIQKKSPAAASYFNLGYIYGEQGDLKTAIDFYKKALEINPQYAKALYNLANAYTDMELYNEAVNLYRRAIKIDPKNSDVYLGLGVAYTALGNHQEAVSCYKKAIEVNPSNSNAYFNLAFSYETTGQIRDAIENYKKTTEIDPAHAEAYYNLGNLYVHLGMTETAVKNYEKAIEVSPEHLNALINLSIVYSQEGEFARSLEYCKRAMALGYEPEAEFLRILKEKTGN
ncbi:MAG: tetratricopeptide repeat protein [Candidatus Omnitrophota bacterium]